jgi:hypothetical protein
MHTVEATNCNRSFAAKDQALASSFNSLVIDFKDMPLGSIQFIWSGIIGTIDGTFKIYASNRPEVATFDPDGTEIDGSSFVPHNASGSRIWIRDRIGFRYALVRWTPNGVTAGTVDIIAMGKKS